MEHDWPRVTADTDEDEVGRLMTKYDLLAMPVVDDEQRLIGIVTLDDALDAIVPGRLEAAPAAAVPLGRGGARARRRRSAAVALATRLPRPRRDRRRGARLLDRSLAPRHGDQRLEVEPVTAPRSPFVLHPRKPPPSSTSGLKRLSSRR